MPKLALAIVACLSTVAAAPPSEAPAKQRIIDVHLHAYPALEPTADDRRWIPDYLPLPVSDEALMEGTLERMDRFNIVRGVLSGSRSLVAAWE